MAGRFNWFLGDVATELSIEGVGPDFVVHPEDARYLDPALVDRPPTLVASPSRPAHLLIHRVTRRTVLEIVRARGAATIVDPRFYYSEDSWRYFHLRRELEPPIYGDRHEAAINSLYRLGHGSRKALVVGTGPSAREILDREISHDIRIVCNSAIRDRAILDHVQPNVVAFGDGMFHFGPSRYAAAFREDLARFASTSDCLFVVPEFAAGLLLARHPELAERTIALGRLPKGDPWRWITPNDTRVRSTGNVLTEFMLPVAFALSDEVDVGGCDGRKPGETYFWSHGRTVQYSDDLMRSVFEAHLPFFRDNDYKDYYERHCGDLAGFIAWAEAQEKAVRSVTTSFIPALVARSGV